MVTDEAMTASNSTSRRTAGLSEEGEADAILELQRFLRRYGYLPPEDAPQEQVHHYTAEDASLDVVTADALLAFQNFHGLSLTGELDEATAALMARPRCAVPDIVTVDVVTPFAAGNRWPGQVARFAIVDTTPDVSANEARAAIRTAVATWAAVIPFTLTESTPETAQIQIGFRSGDHGDGFPFDGPPVVGKSNVWGHGFYPGTAPIAGDVHFDEDDTWSTQTPVPSSRMDLQSAALHELGHALGLDHSSKAAAIMWPYINYGEQKRALDLEDINRIQGLYGVPTRVPLLREDSPQLAADKCREAGLRADFIPKGVQDPWVTLQSPPEGTRVAQGTSVCCRVRRGPRP
jgi:predicted Zn-dependent protease